MRVLVVDDNESLRNLYRDMIKDDGHVVTTAKDGLEAIMRLGTQHYDLVVTDYQMPHADGLSVARDAARRRTPVILVTGYDGEIDDSSVKLILKKPFNIDDFYAAVRPFLHPQHE